MINICPALVLKERQIQSFFNALQEYVYSPFLVSRQLDTLL